MYDKPRPSDYFGDANNLDICDDSNNFKFNSNLQIYINHHKMKKAIEPFYNEYDYFIIIRTDSQILFPFPTKDLFTSESIYLIDANYCKEWGDIGIPGIIHKKYILDFLSCYYDVISSPEYKQPLLYIIHNERLDHLSTKINQEWFFYVCLKLTKLINYIKKIKNINYYWTAEMENDYTTWSVPKLHSSRNLICKYENQCNEAYANLELWNSGHFHWVVTDIERDIQLSST
jgi:hypothetical protein